MNNVVPFPPLREARAAALRAEQVRRYRAFMAATGLRHSRGWSRAGASPLPPDFDHSCLWLDRAGKYIVTTEPYRHVVLMDFAHLTEHGWTLAEPSWPGMWNPPGTRLILASPPRNGGDLFPVLAALRKVAA